MDNLATIINSVFLDVKNREIRGSLQKAFSSSLSELEKIERSFKRLTSSSHNKKSLDQFFHNWSMTNNSAAGLSGYCNRLTMKWRNEDSGIQDQFFLKAISHLHRVSDEDLGATGGMVHFDLYYRMATMICGDDSWLSRQHLISESFDFKSWKERLMLKEKDLFPGLLVTLVHEVYTHGEVEFILPLFSQWLSETSTFSERERQQCLTWIAVHCRGTERQHFNETLQAVDYLVRILQVRLEDYDLEGLFSTYLGYKSDTMEALANILIEQNEPVTVLPSVAALVERV